MGWVKKGVLFEAPGRPEWMASHAALPVVEPRAASAHRVYFSSRDAAGRARIGAFEAAFGDAPHVVAVAAAPVLDLGPLGAFDDNGVTSSCLVEHAGVKYLYYTGWSLGVTVPFYLHAGLAVSEDGGRTFRRASRAPLLDRSDGDPFLTASPWVMVEGGLWRMWYVSGTVWEIVGGKPRHRYHVRYAESDDGVRWNRPGTVCIDYASDEEYALARPCVVRDGDVYRMWFSHRGPRYRLGYAESTDGVRWERRDAEAGLDVSPSGWDSEMVTYPLVFDHEGRRHMLYNGNGYGRTGIGLAILEGEAR